jgi:RNA polymerase sigma factor (sigma-70 family)
MHIIHLSTSLFLLSSLFSLFLYSESYNNIKKELWGPIQTIIQNHENNTVLRKKINYLLYQSFEPWAIHQAYEFKKYHKYKSRNIKIDDFILSSKFGLYRSIKNYNGKTNFPNYSKIHIQGQLYHCLTKFYTLTSVPENERKKSKKNLSVEEKKRYKKQLESSLISYEDYWKFDKIYNNQRSENEQDTNIHSQIVNREKHNEIWEKINERLDPFSKKIFYYKYNYDFKIIRSNREIGELMAYSEEYIRQKLEKSKEKIVVEISKMKEREKIE